MAKAGYSASIAAAVALVANTAKTVVGVLAPAQFGVDWTGFDMSFDGVTASAVPVLVELCSVTFATNPPGTNSTSITLTQDYGRAITAGFTAAYNWTAEPTVVTPFDAFDLTPNGGTIVRDFMQGRTPDSAVSTGFAIRLTAPAVVNCRGTLHFERC
jgi:hypothetical protein